MTGGWGVAVVTGASSGIGRALACELARHGVRVGLTARRADQLDTLAAEIRAAGGTAEVAAADVADRTALVAAVHDLERRLGPVDLMVANAGVGMPTAYDPLDVAGIERMYRVNVFGVLYSIEAVLPGMLARGRGHLVAVSSLGGYKGLPGESGYTSSKAAVNNLMEGLRIQLRPRGVDVTTVCPGFIATPMTAKNQFRMPFLLSADEAARRMVRALRHRPAVYDFPWPMRVLMWLTGWLPDRMIRRAMADYNAAPPA